MYISAAAGSFGLVGTVGGMAYFVYQKRVAHVYQIRNSRDAINFLKSCSTKCTSCDDLNEAIIQSLQQNELSDQQIRHLHHLFCTPNSPIANYALTIIWAMIVFRYTERIMNLELN